jgi:RimJ/RimL family protein N-acetyltransferase
MNDALEWVDRYSDSHSNSDARTGTKSCEYTTVFTAILETARLRLREMVEADVHDVYLLNSSPNVMRYLGAERPLSSLDEALMLLRERIFPQYQSYGVGRWAVILKDNGLFIGWCGLKYEPAANEYDLGYRFIQNYWGKGYATEAARGVLEYCRQHLMGKRIVGKALLENVGSIRVLEKIGMQFERTEEDSDGTVAVYSLNIEH